MRCGAGLASFHNCHCAHSHITALVSLSLAPQPRTNALLTTLAHSHSLTRSLARHSHESAPRKSTLSRTLWTCSDTRSRARRCSRMIRRAGQRIGSDWPGDSHRSCRHHRHCLPGGQFIHGCQQRCNRRPHVSANRCNRIHSLIQVHERDASQHGSWFVTLTAT